jgi:hypothetical protein
MAKKIRKATDAEKRQWAEKKELYPLFGFIKVKGVLGRCVGFWQCEVEYLGEGKDNPNYEIHAPKGMHFMDGCHTLLAETQADCFERLCGNDLVECSKDC